VAVVAKDGVVLLVARQDVARERAVQNLYVGKAVPGGKSGAARGIRYIDGYALASNDVSEGVRVHGDRDRDVVVAHEVDAVAPIEPLDADGGDELVVTGAADEDVGPAVSGDDVVAAGAVERLVGAAPHDHIAEVGADDTLDVHQGVAGGIAGS